MASETATQVKERSVSNGFPPALLYMAGLTFRDLCVLTSDGESAKVDDDTGFILFSLVTIVQTQVEWMCTKSMIYPSVKCAKIYIYIKRSKKYKTSTCI